MTTLYIKESNKLIAEFMGLDIGHDKMVIDPFGSCNWVMPKYHSSWDWLMPVVDKVLFLPRKQKGHYNNIEKLEDGLLQVDINQVYTYVVDFIKWHNSTQEN